MWLGYEDSNLGMLVSETRALPLGDTPTVYCYFLLPDMTPTGAFITMNVFLNWLGYEDSNLGMLVSETRALPLGDTPTISCGNNGLNPLDPLTGGYDGIRTCDPIIMSDVL